MLAWQGRMMLDAFHTQVHVRIGLAALRRRAATPTCLLTASRQPVCRNSGCLKMEVPRSEPERSSPLCLGRVLARCRFLFAPAPHATPPSLRRPQLRSSAPLREPRLAIPSCQQLSFHVHPEGRGSCSLVARTAQLGGQRRCRHACRRDKGNIPSACI